MTLTYLPALGLVRAGTELRKGICIIKFYCLYLLYSLHINISMLPSNLLKHYAVFIHHYIPGRVYILYRLLYYAAIAAAHDCNDLIKKE